MHWFKILLLVLLCLNVLACLINSRKGEYTEVKKAWIAPMGVAFHLLLLWGLVTYL